MDSGNGPFGHFGDLFGAGLLGVVHSVMTPYYESTVGGSSGGRAPDFSEVLGNEFNLTHSEGTTLSEVLGNEQITLSDVVGN